MSELPTWMRRAMLATGVMNVLAAGLFLPGAEALRELAGVPPSAPAPYLLTIALFVLLFGSGYLYCGITGEGNRLFVALSAVGKLGFFTILLGSWLSGAASVLAPLSASPDLFFGALFAAWILGAGATGVSTAPAGSRRRA